MRQSDDLIWVGGIRREIADMLMDIMFKQGARTERLKVLAAVEQMLGRESETTGHGRAKRRAFQQVLTLLKSEP